MEEFENSVKERTEEWKTFYDSSVPHEIKPPEPFSSATGLPKLLILRALRPDKVIPAIQVLSITIRFSPPC